MYKTKQLSLFLCGLMILLLFPILPSCTDDEISPAPPPHIEDDFSGTHSRFGFTLETKKFRASDLVCYFMAENGEVFTREASHLRMRDTSHFELSSGIKEGVYRLLYLQYNLQTKGETVTETYGLGNLFEVTKQGFANRSTYNDDLGFVGSGTEEDPFIISSNDLLYRLQRIVNDKDSERHLLPPNAFYRQEGDLKMSYHSFKADNLYGWIPIGHEPGLPFQGSFDGNGFKISEISCKRDSTFGVGLFGYANNSIFNNIHIDNSQISGLFATSALVGAAVTAGNSRDVTLIRKCRVTNTTITGSEGGFGTAAIIGAVDARVRLVVDSCEVTDGTSIKGSSNVGSILGFGLVSSFSQITNCRNRNTSIEGSQSCVGGIIGSADTLIVQSCINEVNIKGATANNKDTRMGTGGIVGGSGIAMISACSNTASVTGQIGVGGILGSTRVSSDPQPIYNTIVIQSSINSGAISGDESVGGICGESQAAGYALWNEGAVTGNKFVGGIIGALPGGIMLNASNAGSITGNSRCGGIAGKADMASFALNQNYSPVLANGKDVGGILGLGGNSTMVHYCGNFGDITNNSDGSTGGIVGMIGDVRNWSATEIADIVIGSIYILSGGWDLGIMGFDKVLKGIKIGKSVFDVALVSSSFGNSALAFLAGIFTQSPEMERWFASMEQDAALADLQYTELVKTKTDEYMKGVTLTGINAQLNSSLITAHYRDSYKNLLQYIAQNNNDNSNSERFIDTMNKKRNDRAEEVEMREKTKEMVFSLIGGVCSAVAGITFVASLVVTAGGSAAALVAIAAGAASVIGGTNTIVSTVTDYTENSAIITQCINGGVIKGKNENKVCGIVGELEQNCQINDCINLANSGTKGRGYSMAYMHSNAVIEDCVNLGLDWKGDIYTTNTAEVEDCYTLLSDTYSLTDQKSLEELAQVATYVGWSIGGDNSNWIIPSSSKGNYPVPYKSEMQ